MSPRSRGRDVSDERPESAGAGSGADPGSDDGADDGAEAGADGAADDRVDDEVDDEVADDEVVEDPAAELEEAFDEELTHAAEEQDRAVRHEKGHNVFVRLYRGETSFDFIGNRRWWFGASAVIILAGVLSLGVRGLNLGIDFKGGQSWLVSSPTLTVSDATSAVEGAGLTQPTVVQLTNQITHTKQIQVQADLNSKSVAERTAIENNVQDALARAAHTSPGNVNFNDVGPTWGGQVTRKAIEALIVFFIAVTLYISVRFEFKMAVAAIVAVIHDILVTIGIYSLTGFQVTPDTVIAILTVLGYSLYDTVVVFDRIRENARGLGASGRITYSDMVNLSMNQTLARSINTSLVAIVPVLSVLVVGSFLLGATTLQDFGLALVIGLTSGAYSSIFIASPLLALMKEREPRYITIRERLATRGEGTGILTPAAAATMGRSAAASRAPRPKQQAGVIRPGAASRRARGNGAGSATTDAPVPSGVSSGSGTSGGAGRSAGSTRPSGNRPPPRPRKGRGKGGKGKRR